MGKKVSIIIPVYNREKTIERAILSIINQSYNNIELIVVDDGSTDSSLQKIKNIAKENNNVIVISKENTGVSDSRNIGLCKVSGDYVMFLDSDDEYKSNMVEEMIADIKDKELRICYYSNILTNGKKSSFSQMKTISSFDINSCIEKLHKDGLFSIVWNKIYDLSLIKKNNISFDTTLDFGEDFIFNVNYCRLIKYINLIDKDLYLNHNSSTGLARKFRLNRFELVKKHFLLIQELFNETDYSLQYFYSSFVNDIRYSINDLFHLIRDKKELKKHIQTIVKDVEVCTMLQKLENKTWYAKILEKKLVGFIYMVHKINFIIKGR